MGFPIKYVIAVDNLTKKFLFNLDDKFFGPIIKHPVFLFLNIELIKFPNSPEAISFKLFAIVNLVKGLYSNAVRSNFLNGKINLSIIWFSILILTILFDFS